ncbi:MAG: DNA/RNA non-specific endonuclease [Pseudomonadota bacterium]
MVALPAPHQFIDIEQDNRTVHGVTHYVPVKATATLTAANLAQGSGPQNDPPGFVSGDCPEHHQRGHIIGNQLGGPGKNPNLVTLSEGTNHPVMAEFEAAVREKVQASAHALTYQVDILYDEASYSGTADGRWGVLGNPFCLFPAPSSLLLSLYYTDVNGVVQHPLLSRLPDFGRQGNALIVPNGIYKFHYGSQRHVKAGCWAALSATAPTECSRKSCHNTRDASAVSIFHRWHHCPNCQRDYCGTCGGNMPLADFIFRRRKCNKCLTQMLFW